VNSLDDESYMHAKRGFYHYFIKVMLHRIGSNSVEDEIKLRGIKERLQKRVDDIMGYKRLFPGWDYWYSFESDKYQEGI